jgi:uncharacterized repeat protein (TIGR01451 family)
VNSTRWQIMRRAAVAAVAAVLVAGGLAMRPAVSVVPGSNGKIAFESENQIYVMNADGSGKVKLSGGEGLDRNPAWSPDGTKIAFERQPRGGGFPAIVVMDADGTDQRILSPAGEFETDPTWSPDGTRIAFVDFGNEIYVMNADGSGRTNVSNHPAIDISPSWSPDGTRIAFTSFREFPQIMVMNADGSGQTNVSNSGPVNDHTPAWSPDGTRIAFSRETDLWVMDADGSDQRALTSAPGFEGSPAWSPDGTRITFAGTTPEDRLLEIFVMDADGTDILNVSNNPDTRDLGPDWQALPTDGAADLSVALGDAPDPVVAGKELTYTVTVVNDGPAPTAATLVDRLPGTAAFVGASSGCGYDEPSHTVTCGTADLVAQTSTTVAIVVRPTVGGTLTNTVEVAATAVDPDPADNVASTTTTVHGPHDVPSGCGSVPPHANRPPVCR